MQKQSNFQNEADSKTLELLKKRLSDIVTTAADEVNWLDVGCGNGRCLEVLSSIQKQKQKNIFYHGVDSDDTYLAYTVIRAKKLGIKYSVERLFAENLNFEKKYDVITAILLFHEVKPLKLPYILKNLLVALKDDGVLIISDFQEPYEIEKKILIWSYQDIKSILDVICEDVHADFTTMASSKHPKEFSFYQGVIRKSKIDMNGFDNFMKNYDIFLIKKKYSLMRKRDKLRRQIKTRSNEILGKNVDVRISENECVVIEKNIELEYYLKGYKSYLFTRQIEFIDFILSDFFKS